MMSAVKPVRKHPYQQTGLAACLFGLFLFISPQIQASCSNWIAKVVSIQGQVDVRAKGSQSWQGVALNKTYCEGDIIRVQANSRAGLEMHNETILRLNQNSTLILSGPKKAASWVDLIKGSLHSITRVPRSLKIKTPFVNAAVEGTEFIVRVYDDNTLVGVIEGKVAVSNEHGRLLLAQNQAAVTYKGQAPALKLDIKPQDAVQWSLYYPRVNGGLQQAEDLIASGQIAAAELLLAKQTGADALALKSIIAITQNRKQRALDLSAKAVTVDQQSVAAHLARSYALQASFDLPNALKAAQAAVNADKQHAVAWSRVAELQLSNGNMDKGLAAANKAVELDPKLARTQAIVGFARLLQYDIAKAKTAFSQAIGLDSSEPLARLGNGLALIREGQLQKGRREIEIAASLDAQSAQIRSYLGKAYYEENRNKLASEQFDLAKQMDPRDPTPWLYSAILKQTENDPVGALFDLRMSKKLNNNRAVFRSSQHLDADVAARNVGLARIYTDLGSEQQALTSGWEAVNLDHSNHSAHRYLADTYANLPRHKIARVSELLQSQLLAPLSSKPVIPQLAEANLGLNNALGINNALGEYNSLFNQQGTRYHINAIGGNLDTVGGTVNVSGLHNKFAYSIGHYHFETDGFRPNNDLKQDISNIFLQGQVNPATRVQFEYRDTQTEHGDLILDFDPVNFSAGERNMRDVQLFRLGLHHKLDDSSAILLSLLRKETDFDSVITTTSVFGPITVIAEEIDRIDNESNNIELQYLMNKRGMNLVAGVGHYNEDNQIFSVLDQTLFPGPLPFPGVPTITNIDTEYSNIYLYLNKKLGQRVTFTFGLSYDDLSRSLYEVNGFNPKLGAIFAFTPETSLRIAYMESIARPLNGEQTIEPTQVAGFNQFFDDFAATSSKRYGLGLDHQFGKNLSAGVEFTYRELESPIAVIVGTAIDERDEELHRAYLNWHPGNNLSVTADYFYDKQEGSVLNPLDLVTHHVPVRVHFRWGDNFVYVTGNYVDQKVIDTFLAGRDSFWTLDTTIGFNLPKRMGRFSIGVRNILDRSFSYYTREQASIARGPIAPQFVPEQQVQAQLSLVF